MGDSVIRICLWALLMCLWGGRGGNEAVPHAGSGLLFEILGDCNVME